MLNVRRLRNFSAVASGERKMFLEAAALIVITRVAIALVPFRFISKCLELYSCGRRATTPSDDALKNVRLAILRAAPLIPHTTCLTQSLVGAAMMSRRGYPAKICIGVAKRENKFGAHAWVECDGAAVLGSGAGFSRILVLPGAHS